MRSRIKDFLLYCRTVDFGKVELSKRERTFYRRFSKEVLSLCRSLPESAQTDSILFLMRYAGVHLGDEPDFFADYYPPAWSVVYWLRHTRTLPVQRLSKKDMANAVTAQSMAMFLHSLDDHLVDVQLRVSFLTLLLRSQAWTIMNSAFRNLAEGVPSGDRTVRGFIDDYYSSNQDSKGPESLDAYCAVFRKRMAIGTVAPVLLSMKMTGMSDFTRDIESAYGSFGIAWRLLDDINDIEKDMEKGAEAAIYCCLPEELKAHWQNRSVKTQAGHEDAADTILTDALEHGLVEKIKERICTELEAAESVAEVYNMTGLAREFRSLASPLKNSGNA